MDEEDSATAAEDGDSTAVATAVTPEAVRGTLPASGPKGQPLCRIGKRVRSAQIWSKLHQFWLDDSGR